MDKESLKWDPLLKLSLSDLIPDVFKKKSADSEGSTMEPSENSTMETSEYSIMSLESTELIIEDSGILIHISPMQQYGSKTCIVICDKLDAPLHNLMQH